MTFLASTKLFREVLAKFAPAGGGGVDESRRVFSIITQLRIELETWDRCHSKALDLARLSTATPSPYVNSDASYSASMLNFILFLTFFLLKLES
jgi:hypothetical protein